MQREPLNTRGTSKAGEGILVKIFLNCRFHRKIPQSACGCQLPFQGSLIYKVSKITQYVEANNVSRETPSPPYSFVSFCASADKSSLS